MNMTEGQRKEGSIVTAKRVTTVTLQEMKGRGEKITMLTAYDYPIGRGLGGGFVSHGRARV
jgi:hypothetical protein